MPRAFSLWDDKTRLRLCVAILRSSNSMPANWGPISATLPEAYSKAQCKKEFERLMGEAGPDVEATTSTAHPPIANNEEEQAKTTIKSKKRKSAGGETNQKAKRERQELESTLKAKKKTKKEKKLDKQKRKDRAQDGNTSTEVIPGSMELVNVTPEERQSEIAQVGNHPFRRTDPPNSRRPQTAGAPGNLEGIPTRPKFFEMGGREEAFSGRSYQHDLYEGPRSSPSHGGYNRFASRSDHQGNNCFPQKFDDAGPRNLYGANPNSHRSYEASENAYGGPWTPRRESWSRYRHPGSPSPWRGKSISRF